VRPVFESPALRRLRIADEVRLSRRPARPLRTPLHYVCQAERSKGATEVSKNAALAMVSISKSADNRIGDSELQAMPSMLSCAAQLWGSVRASDETVRSAGALPLAMASMMRGDTKASGARNRT
jgi:hypothetical protein